MYDSNDPSILHKVPFFIAVSVNTGTGKTTLIPPKVISFQIESSLKRRIRNFNNNLNASSIHTENSIPEKSFSTRVLNENSA